MTRKTEEKKKSARRGDQSRRWRWRRRLPGTLENEEEADALAVVAEMAMLLTNASAKIGASKVVAANA